MLLMIWQLKCMTWNENKSINRESMSNFIKHFYDPHCLEMIKWNGSPLTLWIVERVRSIDLIIIRYNRIGWLIFDFSLSDKKSLWSRLMRRFNNESGRWTPYIWFLCRRYFPTVSHLLHLILLNSFSLHTIPWASKFTHRMRNRRALLN